MISVVVPLFNKEEFIADTLESILEQTHTAFELIIVNDGSTDNSLRILQTFKDERIQILTIENSGVSVARNTGIEAARYPWIALLDADDRWAPEFLEHMISATQDFPEEKIFAAGRSRVFEGSTERYEHEFLPADGATEKLNYFKVISKYLPLINSSNVIIKKELFASKGMFKPGQKKHEDHDMWLRLCINESVIFVNKPVSFYLKVQTSTASSAYYQPQDFCVYLNTLLAVNSKLSKQEQQWFKSYYNRFVLISYFQNYKRYSKNEDREVFELAKQLVTGKFLTLLKLLKALPFKNTYAIFKMLKG
ncbi:MAG: glycosyltransferase family A protein [Bacteroidota bacterium]